MAYPNTNVFILCFSIVDPDSYSNILSKWIPELNRYAPRVPIILVGTKLDLRNDPSTLEQLTEKHQRPIAQSQGEYLARICSAKAYLECSSMLNFNIRNVFEQAIETYILHEQRYRNGISNGRRILSAKFQSCSWFNSLGISLDANADDRSDESNGEEEVRSSAKTRTAYSCIQIIK
ncbi:unnamed protein product, partial [Rotaria magnacalcarata]